MQTIIEVPENPTNGDMQKAILPKHWEYGTNGNYVHVWGDGGQTMTFTLDWWNAPYQPKEKEPATVSKFHDFYPEDHATWPPADKEVLVQNYVGDKFFAYLEYDDDEDGGWGFYSEDGDFIADVNEIDAWMPIPQHKRDKNYIPIQERRDKDLTLNIDNPGSDEEKDR